MLSLEEVITQILSLRPDLTRKTVQEMIRRKMEGAGRLLTDEGAAYMLANELGVNLSDETALKTKIRIRDLIVGASDVTVTGRVIDVYPVTAFTRNDGTEGKVARLVISDETGRVDVALWDERAEMVSLGRASPNQVVRVNHGYVRAGLDGEPELNVGQRGSVVILSSDSSVYKPVTVSSAFKKIQDLKEGDYYANVVGVVMGASPPTVFKRKDGRKGQVMRVRLADETGRIRVVFWDEKADLVKGVLKNSCLRITNGRLRRGLGDALEVHVGRFSKVIILPEAASEIVMPSDTLTKIGGLNPKMSDVDVLGRVVNVGQTREFTRPSGSVGRVGDLFLMDETGSTRLSLWDEKADLLEEMSVGDVVLVEGAYSRERLAGVELNLGRIGTLTVNPDMGEAEKLPPLSEDATPISQLKMGLNTLIEGRISEAPSVRTITTRDGREMKVASLRIRDQTGEIRVSLWRRLADKTEKLPLGTGLRIRNAFVRIGFNGSLELSSRSITEIEFLEEAGEEPEKRLTRVD
jgi:replication factor A1